MNNPIFEQYTDIIPEFSLFQEVLQEPLPAHLRINSLKKNPEFVIRSLKSKAIYLEKSLEHEQCLYHAPELEQPGNLLEYFLGYIHPQALTSCLTTLALSPSEGSYVLDMCSSPGGKTSHMAQLMNNSGLIIANELYPNRHIPLGHTIDRLGVLNTVVSGYQAQEFPLRQRFDYILADVPCSGEGRFRKVRETSTYRKPSDRFKIPDLQKKIIIRSFDLLENGGEMIYATCTYNPDENESVVNYLLQSRPAKLLPIKDNFKYDPGLTEWNDEKYDKQISKTARFYPHRLNSVGFFMARIGR